MQKNQDAFNFRNFICVHKFWEERKVVFIWEKSLMNGQLISKESWYM